MNTEKTTMETVIEKLGPLISPELGKWLLDQEKREHQIWFNKGFEIGRAHV